MDRSRAPFVALLALASLLPMRSAIPFQNSARSSNPADGIWYFAVSGDSRNCGDVVMPAIAAGVIQSGASFYWHLGDFRAIYEFDEDMQHQPEHLAKPMDIA